MTEWVDARDRVLRTPKRRVGYEEGDSVVVTELAEDTRKRVEEEVDPRLHASHVEWRCVGTDGAPTGHPDFHQRINIGGFPSCPICQGGGLPVSAAEAMGL